MVNAVPKLENRAKLDLNIYKIIDLQRTISKYFAKYSRFLVLSPTWDYWDHYR